MDDSPAGGSRPEEIPPGPAGPADTGRPLPDLMAICLAEVPACWPPYDDEITGAPAPVRDVTAVAYAAGGPPADGAGEPGSSGTARGRASEAVGRTDPEPAAKPARTDPEPAGEAGGGTAAGQAGECGAGPEGPGQWPGQFAQVLAETLAGSRPASQMTPWTTERVRARIRRLGPLLAAGQRPRVQRVLTSRPGEDVVEVAVVVGFGPRTRALAARLERAGPRTGTPGRPARQARWVCTAVESA